MKLSKSSIIAASALGAIALTAVGFAGWYIVASTNSSATGNIMVYDITRKDLTITDGKWNDSKSSIIFGYPSTQTAHTSAWLKYTTEGDDGVKEECLSLTYTLNLNDYSKGSTPTVSATLKLDTGSAANGAKNYCTCIDNKYITGPSLVTKDSSDTYSVDTGVTVTNSTSGGQTASSTTGLSLTVGSASDSQDADYKTYKVTIKLDFGWGEHFKDSTQGKNINPYDYYNSKTGSASVENGGSDSRTYIEDAMKAMGAIYGLKNLGYTLTINASNAEN